MGVPPGGWLGDLAAVGVELPGGPGDAGEDRVGRAEEAGADLGEADLGLVHAADLPAQGDGEELTAEADAHDRQVLGVGQFEVVDLGLHPGVLIHLIGVGVAAHGDDAVDAVEVGRQVDALVEGVDLQAVSELVEDRAEAAGGLEGVVFEDDDGHARSVACGDS